MTKGIIYYACDGHPQEIDEMCRQQLLKAGLPIVCVSLNKQLDFGFKSVMVKGERGVLTMHRQIKMALELSDADYVFMCESDVMYHPSHFDFTPTDDNTIYYNTNVWKRRWPDDYYVWTDDLQQVSGVCAHRKTLLEFYTKRIAQIEAEGFNRHYEPGIHQTVGTRRVENWQSKYPNICVRHDGNFTKTKWSPDEFRNKKYAKGWKESNALAGWKQFNVGG